MFSIVKMPEKQVTKEEKNDYEKENEDENEEIEEKEKEDEKTKTLLTIFQENIIRKISNRYHPFFLQCNKTFQQCYIYIHNFLIVFTSFIFLFSNNLFHLAIVLLIISLDAFSIVVMHNCPLTQMEKKFLNTSTSDERKRIMKNLGISYHCDHIYEQQIELMINVWLIVVGKILVILFLKTANIRLINYNGIYINP